MSYGNVSELTINLKHNLHISLITSSMGLLYVCVSNLWQDYVMLLSLPSLHMDGTGKQYLHAKINFKVIFNMT